MKFLWVLGLAAFGLSHGLHTPTEWIHCAMWATSVCAENWRTQAWQSNEAAPVQQLVRCF